MTKPKVSEPQATDPKVTEPQATDPKVTAPQAPEPQTDPPLRLVRGTASPEELSALITVVAVLSADQDPDHRDLPGGQRRSTGRSMWNAPSRMVGMTNQPERGGWRASAYPR